MTQLATVIAGFENGQPGSVGCTHRQQAKCKSQPKIQIRGRQTFSVKGHIFCILGFADHTVCHYSALEWCENSHRQDVTN